MNLISRLARFSLFSFIALAAAVAVFAQSAPTVSVQPTPLVVDAGASAFFYISYNGNPTPTFHWQRLPSGSGSWANLVEGTSYSGVTTNYLNIALATPAMNGDQFRCVLVSILGTATSSPAVLTVSPAVLPQIVGLSPAITVNSGDYLNFSPVILGSAPITFQWKKGGVAITGATSSSFYKGSASTADNGQYSLTATNYAGAVTSSAVTVTVNPAIAPAIFNLPETASVDLGTAFSLRPSISGSQPITYQWKKGGAALTGATSLQYDKNSSVVGDAGQYTLTATNSAGTATSTAVTVTINAAVAPAVFGLPTNTTLTYGGYVNLTPSITGTQPVTFQWKKNGVAIAGATSGSYSAVVTPVDNGQYTLTATNSVASVTSSIASLVVLPAVIPVLYMPADFSVNYGDSLSFSPSVNGTSPITFQWKKDGVAIAGATSAYFNKSGGATVADSGLYALTATNVAGTVTSPTVKVTVKPAAAPTISFASTNLSVNYGESLTLYSTVSGTQPITLQWKKDGVILANAIYNSYTISSATSADNGQYTLTAVNSVGTATSVAVTVSVNAAVAPSISGLPPSVALVYGETLSLYPSVSGSQTMSFQWKKGGTNLGSGTSSSYYKSGMTTADAGQYTLTATNTAGTATSSIVTVTVQAAVAPAIFNLPTTVTINYGDQLYLYPFVTGTQPITFQWKKNGANLANATSGSYSKYSETTTADSGQYTLTATNSVGTVTSSAVTVTINPAVAPGIYNLPAKLTVDYGAPFNISPTISGTNPITFQWKKGGVNIPNATSGSYGKSNLTTADNGVYTLTATNVAGTVTSSAVTLTVNPAVAVGIYNLPTSLTIPYGNSLNLSPLITGTQPITFQWKKDGVEASNATSSGYYRDYATLADSGLYKLEATNVVGTTTSTGVAVVVSAAIAPAITQQPRSISITQGLTANFSVQCTGTNPFSFQWNLKGQAIDGATSSTLIIPNVQASNLGNYTVTITNPGGSVTSNVAVLSLAFSVGVISASASDNSSLYVKADGTLWGMGYNGNSQLGQSTIYPYYVANQIQIASQVVAAAVGPFHTLFIKSDGTLWGMGSNSYGQLGDGTTSNHTDPFQIASGVVSMAVGANHSLFIKSDGSLWGMGDNSYGALGDGTNTNRISPIQIATDVLSATAGDGDSLFVKSDGSLWAVGNNQSGQLGTGTYGVYNTPVKIATGIISANAGVSYSFFIGDNGTLWAMGANYSGQFGDGTSTSHASPEAIANNVSNADTGLGHSLYVNINGTLRGMGSNSSGQLGLSSSIYTEYTPTQLNTGVASAAAGGYHSLFIKTDGSLWAMGNNSYGQLGDGTGITQGTPVQIASGAVTTPSAPTGVFASDGELDTGVRLTWSPTIGTNHYEVWRNTTNNSASATRIASNVPIALAYDRTVTLGVTYYYWIKAVNNAGASALSVVNAGHSSAAKLPVITTQPGNRSSTPGNPVTFTIAATGVPTPTYQWKHNDANIVGANGSTYTIPNLSFGDAGAYSIVATNSVGSVTSNTVTLNVVLSSPAYFDSDDSSDIIWHNTNTGLVTSWESTAGFTTFGTEGGGWSIVATGDFDGDGRSEPLWHNISTGVVASWNSTTGYHVYGNESGGWSVITVGDFDGDHHSEPLWRNSTTGIVAAWTSASGYKVYGTEGGGWSVFGTGDFDADGKTDLLWHNSSTGVVTATLATGGGLSLGTEGGGWFVVGAGDFDGDGKADVLWHNTISGVVTAVLTAGGGITLESETGGWSIISIGDFDGDGKDEVLWRNSSSGTVSSWTSGGTYQIFGAEGSGWRVLF